LADIAKVWFDTDNCAHHLLLVIAFAYELATV
jgi:hypothetical protein